MLTASDVTEWLRTEVQEQGEPIEAFWIAVDGSRHEVVDKVEAECFSVPVIPVAVTGGLFEDANAVLDDLVTLLSQARSKFAGQQAAHIREKGRCVFVLVSRSPLTIPQVSSPVVIPEWFPVCAGELLTIRMRDMTWVAQVPLSDASIAIDSLRAELFGVELALQDRLLRVHQNSHGAGNALWEMLKSTVRDVPSYAEFLQRCAQGAATIAEAKGFRPSVTDGRAVTSAILATWTKLSPDSLHKFSSALSVALGIPVGWDGQFHVAVGTVVYRSASPRWDQTPIGVRFCRNLITAVGWSIQISTACAHADGYPRFSAPLLKSLSIDLRKALHDGSQSLRVLD